MVYLNDVRQKALDKAKQHAADVASGQTSSGNGFESERQHAKNMLRNEIGTYQGENVHKIAAIDLTANDERRLRVAAYCRVSTDDIDQLLSIEMQKANYKKMIRENPRWIYVGTYVDDGFSGTNTDHRPAFQLMMRDAMSGKIDMIITKSVSRFARNLLDCISWVRRLQEHDPPIAVMFEQENLNTLASTSNLILFVLAMVAEEESHMKSEAMLLSLEWRFSRGRFLTPKLLGYDAVKDENGRKQLIINPEEAKTIEMMYSMLLNGSSPEQIADTLTDLHRFTGGRRKDGSPNTTWSASGVTCVMRNERYCGDVLARKTWTPNYRDHKSKKNRGKKNKYYQPAHHKPIVTRAQWNAAQRILNSRRYGHKGGYLPMKVIDHGALCGYISINRSWAGFEADEYYRISSIAMGLSEGDMESDLEKEHLPEGGYSISGLADDNGVQRIARELTEIELATKNQLEGIEDIKEELQEEKLVGFQVAKAEMFSHAYDPILRFSKSSVSFNMACVKKLKSALQQSNPFTAGEDEVGDVVEILFNPVERMIAVRPCSSKNANAVPWIKKDGKTAGLGARAFCKNLYQIMDWDEDIAYKIPAALRSKNGEAILFFDLDNAIIKPGKAMMRPEINHSDKEPEMRTEDVKGIFYAGDDEPQPIEDIEEMEQKLRQTAELEKRRFGIPVYEHAGDLRLPAIDEDGEWGIMTPAQALDSDHRVDETVVRNLYEELSPATSQREDMK